MSQLSIEQTLINSDFKIQEINLQDPLNISEILNDYSFLTIEPFKDQSINYRTTSPNWLHSSFNPGFIDTTTISLSFLQCLSCEQDFYFNIFLTEPFWSKYEPVDGTTNTYGNVADGKTHLDSVAEAVFNAVLGALESFVKAVTELASSAIKWILEKMNSLFNPIRKTIEDMFKKLGAKILYAFSFLPYEQYSNGRITQKELDDQVAEAKFHRMLWDLMILPLAIIEIMLYLLMVLETISKPIPGVFDLISNAIEPLITGIIIGAVLSITIGISGTLLSTWSEHGNNEGTDVYKNIVNTIGLPIKVTSWILIGLKIFSTFYLYLKTGAMKYISSTGLAFIGLLISISLSYVGLNFLTLIGDCIGLGLAIIGAIRAFGNKDPLEVAKQKFSAIYRVFSKIFTIIAIITIIAKMISSIPIYTEWTQVIERGTSG